MKLEQAMQIAIKEARESLREGNNGFGAVIIKDEMIIASAHDREDTDADATSHAELNAIKTASRIIGKDLSGCILVATHEPCPMCAGAILWSGIQTIAYGYSIQDAAVQGRKRIGIPCKELFDRANVQVAVHAGVLNNACAVLYRNDVRREIKNLRGADEKALAELCEDSVRRRVSWFQDNQERFHSSGDDLLDSAYRLLLERLHLSPAEAPVVRKTKQELVFHSQNFCPTLEACNILGLNTRHICARLNEASMDTLLKQLNPKLQFSRNYEKLRPYAGYCEEKISLQAE